MRIDKVYIACYKNDFYLTKICVASIRYWNSSIPIILIKDLSHGDFDTSLMEKRFNVSIAPITYSNLGGYSKLYPYMNVKNERVLLIDSDIVWLGDIIPSLEKFDEDFIADCYSPDEADAELNKWYINTANFNKHYKAFHYPGFLFNAGQLVFSTSVFKADDFKNIIEWKDKLSPMVEGVFLCEEQGIINYIITEKLKRNELSIAKFHFFLWGWSEEVENFRLSDIKEKKGHPYLVHWFGKKNGLISFLPNSNLLRFYENYYYEHIKHGRIKQAIDRTKRILKHPAAFSWEVTKLIFRKIKHGKIKV